jgi:hypothetical protein
MRNFILLLLLIPIITKAQEYKLEDKTVSSVFEVKEKTKAEIYASINKWVSINYNSAKNVVQMNDLESGTIIIKGINEVNYNNLMVEILSKVQEYSKNNFNHLIEINIKDNKFRIVYKITNMVIEDIGLNSLFLNCISFDGKNENAILAYNEKIEEVLKRGFFVNQGYYFVGKGKREQLKSLTKSFFEEVSNALVSDIKSTIQSIEKSITETKKDNW